MERNKVSFKTIGDIKKFLKNYPDETPVMNFSIMDGNSPLGAYTDTLPEWVNEEDEIFIAFGSSEEIEEYR